MGGLSKIAVDQTEQAARTIAPSGKPNGVKGRIIRDLQECGGSRCVRARKMTGRQETLRKEFEIRLLRRGSTGELCGGDGLDPVGKLLVYPIAWGYDGNSHLPWPPVRVLHCR